jgi:cytidine deaminase
MKLTAKDKELIAAATDAIKSRYRNDWQEVGAALRTRDGRMVTGVNLDAYVGRGDIAVVSPCGACRELIHDYDAKARVIVPGGKTPTIVTIGELLPNKYRRGMT